MICSTSKLLVAQHQELANLVVESKKSSRIRKGAEDMTRMDEGTVDLVQFWMIAIATMEWNT